MNVIYRFFPFASICVLHVGVCLKRQTLAKLGQDVCACEITHTYRYASKYRIHDFDALIRFLGPILRSSRRNNNNSICRVCMWNNKNE